MESTFHPSHRKWISPLINLGEMMEELKELVPAEDLLVVEPSEEARAGTNTSGNPMGNVRQPPVVCVESEDDDEEYLNFIEREVVETDEKETRGTPKRKEPAVPGTSASAKVAGPSPSTSTKSATQGTSARAAGEGTSVRGADEGTPAKAATEETPARAAREGTSTRVSVVNKNANKLSEDDVVCESAVIKVGGKDFFTFGKKQKKEDGKPHQRGRRSRKTEEMDTGNSDDSDADDSDIEEIGQEDRQSDIDEMEEEEEKNTADFKRFTDWVFNQNRKRDLEERENFQADLMEALNLPEDEVRNLLEHTNADLASVRGEVFQDDPVMQSSSMPLLAPPTNKNARTTLQSLAVFITHGEDPSVFPWKSTNVQQQMNDDFVNHEFLKRMEQQKLDIVNPAKKRELVNKEDDFLVQVLIYQATDPDEKLPDEITLDLEPKLAYELHLLGSQTVRDLMMYFHCENDYVCLQDVNHPDHFKEHQAKYAKDEFPAKMILINETIYTDPSCDVDYVEIINKWAEKPPRKDIGPFRKGDWNTKLCDVNLRFGFPYVFIHLGGCEHIYVFTKSRLLHVEDDHLITNYPKIVGMTQFKNVYCSVDNEYLARWAVLDYKEFPENPMLLCTECVLTYCYDGQKKKRGDFRLYPFTQMANIL